MKTMQRGFTLVEVLGALAIGVVMMVGLVALIVRSMDDTKGQQASLHQAQVTAAAAKYIRQNYDTLRTAATATNAVAVTVAQLKAARLLSDSFVATNSYGQTACVLVLQPDPGKLEALVVTEGGAQAIPVKDIGAVAAHAGAGAGYVSHEAPLHAVGSFGSWNMPAAVLANYTSASCSGTPVGAGRLANAIFFDGPDTADFVYRGKVDGHPELNRMTTPLHMAAVATEGDTADPLCVAGDPSTQGRIAADAGGAVLSCQAGAWKRQGSAFWREPVDSFAVLPVADNHVGDARMVTDVSRAFTWSGTAWLPFAVDQNGNLSVPNTASAGMVQLNTTVVKNTGCPTAGLIARDAEGRPLVCSNGSWRNVREYRVTTTAYENSFRFEPGDGIQDFFIDISSLPGPRPLYLTGYAICNNTGIRRAWAVVEPFDAAGNRLGYSGGCGARSSPNDGRVTVKGMVPLTKLPANAALLRVYMEPGGRGEDYSFLQIYVKNSE